MADNASPPAGRLGSVSKTLSMAKVAGQAVLSEEGAKALSEGLWERMGSMGFELFHHNRASLYSAAQVFDLVSFVLVFMALMSIVPEQSITHNTSWMTGKVSNGPWLFPDDSSSAVDGFRAVESVRYGLAAIVFLDANDKVVRYVEWGEMPDNPNFNCGSSCKSCSGVGKPVRVSVIVSCVMLCVAMLFSQKRKSKETDTHHYKFICSGLAGVASLFGIVSMVQFNAICAKSPPTDGLEFSVQGVRR
jgi:hypothetical protein